jgi:hypothetical protein
MTPEEKIQKIKEVYEKANARLGELLKKRKEILKGEIDQMEADEIERLRASLLKLTNNQE